jgi:hypothetical protein
MMQNINVLSSRWFRSVLVLVGVALWFALTVPPSFAAPDSAPCSASTESRQFDYWLGDWTITYPGAPGGSTSTVRLELDKCMVVERWDGGKGHSGENLFAYSADDKKWHGMFADNQGRAHVFEGKVAGGVAEFYGPSRGPNGEAVLNRIRIIRISGDKVEQSWEKSTDNGGTWTTGFRGEYSRKNQ